MKMKYKAMTRQQLAESAGVCRQTLTNWLNSDLKILKKLGVKERGVLPPSAVKYICEKYCIEIDS